MDTASKTVRDCLLAIKPQLNLEALSDTTPLLKERIITSFEVLDLILYLEKASGRPITRTQLVPGSFRDIETIVRVFLRPEKSA
jgi:acyl carrier protein